MTKMTENDLEYLAIDFLKEIGYEYIHGAEFAHDNEESRLPAEYRRNDYSEVVLAGYLNDALRSLNPDIPDDALAEVSRKIQNISSDSLIYSNEEFHKYLTNGFDVEYRFDGRIIGNKVWLIDFENPDNNHFLAVNQFTIIEDNINKRPDLIIFINGLPLVVFELKNPVNEKATIVKAYTQLQNYKKAIPSLFNYNELLIISDGLSTRTGTLTSPKSRFMEWKTIDGKVEAPKTESQIDVLIHGMLNKPTLLDLIKHFIVFEKASKEDVKTGLKTYETYKKVAAYHQYFAVNKAIRTSMLAASDKGDGRGGVIWHTQGSGKSLSMVFYTGKMVLSLNNPTIVVITDRNDLDGQLFDTFSNCQGLLRQEPRQASSTEHLMELLRVDSGGIVFTTIQKFFPDRRDIEKLDFPTLSERKNIIVITDEAHRTQYGFAAKVKLDEKKEQSYITYGYAKYLRDALPQATFLGFTGTPIELKDRNTKDVFGDYIDIYDIEQSIRDGATVSIFYESRLAHVKLKKGKEKTIDMEFEEVTESRELTERQKLKSKWARIEAIVGDPGRLTTLAEDLVKHFEQRDEAMVGKAMVVCMSRRISVDLYNALIKLRPEWHNEDDDKGFLKVVMTGSSSDDANWQQHIRNKKRRRYIGGRLKNPDDELQMVIVRDMWLTGFDAPCLHTLYIDKMMKGHNLMQAIARVNRVFGDKPGGLIVDYLGIAQDLKQALINYTDSGGQGTPIMDKEQAVTLMLEKFEIVQNLFDKFDYKKFFDAPTKEKLRIILSAEDFILGLDDGKDRLYKHVDGLSKAFALSVPHRKAMAIKDEVAFFQAVKAGLIKTTGGDGGPTDEDIETAVKQLVSKSISSEGVKDIFAELGKEKPEISILSEKFLEEVQGLKRKNLALELLKKLLRDELRLRARKNLIISKKFSEMLSKTINKYNNNLLSTREIISALINMAREFKKEIERGKKLGLSEDELAFYDALGVNDSAVQVLGDEILKDIAKELVDKVRKNASIDWTIRETVKAKMRVIIKRILRKHKYPPDKTEQAVQTVIEQAEHLAQDWSEAA